MKFNLHQASNLNYVDTPNVEVNTIEDLKKISDEYGGEDLIIEFNCSWRKTPQIIVYDAYFE